jgi:hypothetical protein
MGGAPGRHDSRATILRALPVLIAHPYVPWEQLLSALMQAGLSRAEAVEVAIFVPLAFGRALLASKFITILHSGYLRVDEEGSHSLSDVPEFSAAYELAWQLFLAGDQLTYDQFIAVAGRSNELQNANRMLDQGSKFSDIMIGPAIITVPKEPPAEDEPVWAEIVE